MSGLDLWRTLSDWAALFAASQRDYWDSCKTACNLAACGDGDSVSAQSCKEQACLLVKSLSLGRARAHPDILAHRTRHKGAHACVQTEENYVWKAVALIAALTAPSGLQCLVIHLFAEFRTLQFWIQLRVARKTKIHHREQRIKECKVSK